ncbi:hypothetical protein ZIOFF_038713 [Zingiber officinale]|uniref:Transmembrane protein n=1 Tax=Zingiber officinale TaxID=94328 RepID=A0A8J5G1Y7_ZINOF|nr:hypothetical protein ZIOFF_038713 [Zingiber officinale]
MSNGSCDLKTLDFFSLFKLLAPAPEKPSIDSKCLFLLAATTTTMAFVVVISLPFILFTILLAFACYFLGRAKGRKDVRNGIGSQVYGVPLPPPGAESGSSPSAPPPRLNKQGLEDV